jgi:hypothetical protein
MRYAKWIGLIVLVIMAGCAVPKLNTPSGKPEVFVPATSPSVVRAKIIDGMMQAGSTLEQDTPNSVVFSKESNDFGAQLLLGSNYDSRVFYRARFTVVDRGGGTQVYGDVGYVTNYHSAHEQETPAAGKVLIEMQGALERLRDSLATGP